MLVSGVVWMLVTQVMQQRKWAAQWATVQVQMHKDAPSYSSFCPAHWTKSEKVATNQLLSNEASHTVPHNESWTVGFVWSTRPPVLFILWELGVKEDTRRVQKQNKKEKMVCWNILARCLSVRFMGPWRTQEGQHSLVLCPCLGW